MAWVSSGRAGTLFSEGFESAEGYVAGDDQIAGKNHWLGTTSAGTGRSGIDSEDTHGTIGIGNAGWIGGNTTQVTWAGNSINVRRLLTSDAPYFYDPAGVGAEVVHITALVGIQDSSASARRDRFELFLMNGAATATGSGDVLAAIQFDNVTAEDGVPQQLVRRTQSSPGTKALSYVNTGARFPYDTLQFLSLRVNFRTNLWTGTLDGVPLFVDQPFYTGSAQVNLGAAGFRMLFGTASHEAPSYTCIGGDNYLLFDDFSVRADPPGDPAPELVTDASGVFLQWTTEAGYKYQVHSSSTLVDWEPRLSALLTAENTGQSGFRDSTAIGQAERFYRISRSDP